jgi:hypothetical protein
MKDSILYMDVAEWQMLDHKNINDDQKKWYHHRPAYSILPHKHGSHAHARADAHARHEDSLVCLPSDV